MLATPTPARTRRGRPKKVSSPPVSTKSISIVRRQILRSCNIIVCFLFDRKVHRKNLISMIPDRTRTVCAEAFDLEGQSKLIILFPQVPPSKNHLLVNWKIPKGNWFSLLELLGVNLERPRPMVKKLPIRLSLFRLKMRTMPLMRTLWDSAASAGCTMPSVPTFFYQLKRYDVRTSSPTV